MPSSAAIASLIAPAPASAAGRSAAFAADAGSDTSFDAMLQQVQAQDLTPGTEPSDTVPSTQTPLVPAAATASMPVTQGEQTEAATPSIPAITLPAFAVSTDVEGKTGAEIEQVLPADMASMAALVAFTQATPADTPTQEAAAGTSQTPALPSAIQAQMLATASSPDNANTQLPLANITDSARAPDTTQPPTGADAARLAELAALASRAPQQATSDAPRTSRQPQAQQANGQTAPVNTTTATQTASVTELPNEATVRAMGSNTSGEQPTLPAGPNADQSPATTSPAAALSQGPAPSFNVELKQAIAQHGTFAAQPPVPIDALAVSIARKVEQGLNQFEISLTPMELGKLDISLKIADDGRVQATLRAERQETLDLLRHDAKTLETQLRQAGLDVGANALSFELSHGNANKHRAAQPDYANRFPDSDTRQSDEPVATIFTASRRKDGVDIHV